MSPEQARGEALDARNNLFSLGAVLYEMATARPAFAGKTTAVIFQQILGADPQPPRELNDGLPRKLDEIILKALEKDRDLRYRTAADLRGDLKRLKRDTGPARLNFQPRPWRDASATVERRRPFIGGQTSQGTHERPRGTASSAGGVCGLWRLRTGRKQHAACDEPRRFPNQHEPVDHQR